MKVFINWFINCNCCVWFFSRASSTPVSFTLKGFHSLTEKTDSSSSCSFRGTLEVLARFLSSLHWLFLSLFLFRPNTAKDCSNCTSELSLSSAFSVLLFADLTNAGKCLAWIIQGDWRSRCLYAPEQNLFRRRMARFSCLLLSGYNYDPLPLYTKKVKVVRILKTGNMSMSVVCWEGLVLR